MTYELGFGSAGFRCCWAWLFLRDFLVCVSRDGIAIALLFAVWATTFLTFV